jgi:hypothetical protein
VLCEDRMTGWVGRRLEEINDGGIARVLEARGQGLNE